MDSQQASVCFQWISVHDNRKKMPQQCKRRCQQTQRDSEQNQPRDQSTSFPSFSELNHFSRINKHCRNKDLPPYRITSIPVLELIEALSESAAPWHFSTILPFTYSPAIHKQVIKFPLTVSMDEMKTCVYFLQRRHRGMYHFIKMFPITLTV